MSDVNRMDYIDALKGIAMLGVYLVHSTQYLGALHISSLPLNIEKVFYLGRYGVVIFFILSSFMLFRSLDMRPAKESASVGKYFIRRFFKIAPAYYFILCVIYFTTNGVEEYRNPDQAGLQLKDFFLHLTFLNGFDVYTYNNFLGTEWFIFVIVIFYFIFPLLYKHLMIRTFSVLTATAFVASIATPKLLSKYVGLNEQTRTWIYLSPITWLFVLLGGGILYLTCCRKSDASFIRIIAKHQTKIIWLLFFAFLLLAYVRFHFEMYALVAISFMLVICLQSDLKSRILNGLINNVFFKGLGKISYSLYLIHYPIIRFLSDRVSERTFIVSPLVVYAICAVGTFIVVVFISILMRKFIERPGIAAGRSVVSYVYGSKELSSARH